MRMSADKKLGRFHQQAVNPLTAKLPRTEGLTGSDRREFLAQAKEIVPQLRFD